MIPGCSFTCGKAGPPLSRRRRHVPRALIYHRAVSRSTKAVERLVEVDAPVGLDWHPLFEQLSPGQLDPAPHVERDLAGTLRDGLRAALPRGALRAQPRHPL